MLDFDGDLYDQPAQVRFPRRIRGQERFDSVDDLDRPDDRDVDAVRCAKWLIRRRSWTWLSRSGSLSALESESNEGLNARMPDKAATIATTSATTPTLALPKCRSRSSPSASGT